MTCLNPLGWILASEAVCGDFNKTQLLLFHSLSLSSEGCGFALHAEICQLIQRKSRGAQGGRFSVLCSVTPTCADADVCFVCVCVFVSHLCDHGKSQDEKADTADQGEERLVFPQIFGELI